MRLDYDVMPDIRSGRAGAIMVGRDHLAALCVAFLLVGCNREKEAPQTAPAAAVVASAPAPETAVGPAPVEKAATAVGDAESAPAVPAADADMLRPSFATCIDAAKANDFEMQACIADEYAYHDDRLNAAYAKLRRALVADSMANLRNVQRTWLRDRDANCAWDAENEGSAQRLQANYCLMEATAKRADELEALLDSDE
jgi:uncharacterized protein YecT (DUF1311 family)